MTQPNDPYKTQRLPPLTQTLAQPIQLPLAAVVALAVMPALILGGLLLVWAMQRQPTPTASALRPSPTLGLPRASSAAHGLPRAVVAYDAPDGRTLGALEPGRSYRVVARSGLQWIQIDVAQPGETPNLVWVAAGAVPETQVAATLADLATPLPTTTPQVVYVAAPAPAVAAPPAEPAIRAGEPTAAYVLPPATPAPRSVVVVPYPTATPCAVRDLGLSLRPCNGYVR